MKEGDGAGGGGDNPRANWLVRVGETGHRNIQGTGGRTISCVGPGSATHGLVGRSVLWRGRSSCGKGRPPPHRAAIFVTTTPTASRSPRLSTAARAALSSSHRPISVHQTLSSRPKSCSRRPQILQRCWELFGAEVLGGLGYWTITSNQYYQGGREDKPKVSQEPPKFYGTEDAYLPAIMA